MKYKQISTILLSILLVLSALSYHAFSDDQLHKAAHNGDIETVRALLKKQPDPDERDSFGGTALHAAMFQDNLEIIELLLDAGLDVNAQGTSNGYTPLHDAVWSNNLAAAKLLVKRGAKAGLKNNDGLTPYEKAVKENKTELAAYLRGLAQRSYDADARNFFSENDVKALVYSWFAGFDHQLEPEHFTVHLDAGHVDMQFPDFPINSIQDFLTWYQGVIDTVQWNSHQISSLEVSGNERNGFSVSLNVRWRVKTYEGQDHDLKVHQDWQLSVDEDRQFIITRHRATLIQ